MTSSDERLRKSIIEGLRSFFRKQVYFRVHLRKLSRHSVSDQMDYLRLLAALQDLKEPRRSELIRDFDIPPDSLESLVSYYMWLAEVDSIMEKDPWTLE